MSTTITVLCDECHVRPAGHGHFALYCEPCSVLPYGHAAPVDCSGCGDPLRQQDEKALSGEVQRVWTSDRTGGWVCPTTGNEHEPVTA